MSRISVFELVTVCRNVHWLPNGSCSSLARNRTHFYEGSSIVPRGYFSLIYLFYSFDENRKHEKRKENDNFIYFYSFYSFYKRIKVGFDFSVEQ